MADAGAGLHEGIERLRLETVDHHRAVVSLMEELAAVDWYDQRVDAAGDEALRAILAHHRDEEKEHAAMLLEWLRRHDGSLDEHLRRYLFSEQAVVDIEAAAGAQESEGAGSVDESLGIGSLRREGA